MLRRVCVYDVRDMKGTSMDFYPTFVDPFLCTHLIYNDATFNGITVTPDGGK